MAKRILAGLLAVSMLFGVAFGLTACANHEKPTEGVTAPADETAEAIESLKKQIAELQTLIKNLTDKYTEDNEALSEQIKKLQALNMELSKRLDALEGRPVLDKEIEAEIKNAYYNLNKKDFDNCNATAADISIFFCGEYSGSYVMFVHSAVYSYEDAVSPEVIDGVLFNYSSGHKMDVYNNGMFYSVSEAFNQDLLTHTDLLNLVGNWGEFIYSIKFDRS